MNGRNSSSGPHRTLPGMSLYVSSTQEYERKTTERSKRKKAKNKFCARSRQGYSEEVQHRPLFNSAKSLYREQAADTSTNYCIFVIGCPRPLRQILRRTGKADLHNPCLMCIMTEYAPNGFSQTSQGSRTFVIRFGDAICKPSRDNDRRSTALVPIKRIA